MRGFGRDNFQLLITLVFIPYSEVRVRIPYSVPFPYPKFGRCNDGIRIKFQKWVRNTVRVRKNFEIKVRVRNGYGLILSNIVRVRVRVRVRIGLSQGYGNWNSFDKIWKFKIYTTLVFLSIYIYIYEKKMKSTTRSSLKNTSNAKA